MTKERWTLLAILLVALAVRLWGIGFGLPYLAARPDETEIAGPAVGFLSGDLRPPFFEWPTLFAYTVASLYVLYFFITRPFSSYKTLAAFAESRRISIAPFLYVSRALSVAMGVATVWWVAALSRRVFDETVGLVAALFLSLCFLHVRDSHFGTTDVAMTGLVVLTVGLIFRWRETGLLRHAAVAGLAGGLAASTKYNGLGVCVPFGIALIQRLSEEKETPGAVTRFVAAGSLFALSLAAGFFGASPYILIDWTRFLTSVSGVETHLLQGHGIDLGRGWWYYGRVVLPAAVGWPILLTGLAGMILLMSTRFRDAIVLFAFPLSYYLLAGRGHTVFARYVIPVLPFLCIAAAWFVVESVRVMTRTATPRLQRPIIATATACVVLPTAYNTVMIDRLFATPDNRIVVAKAIDEMALSDSSLYQSGERYGYVPLVMDGRALAHVAHFDEAAGRFDSEDPDWILLQQSPLVLYSRVPESLASIVRQRYELVRSFPASIERAGRVYDQQDAFFIPLSGLEGIIRPGPSFELYRRRSVADQIRRPAGTETGTAR